MEAQSSKPTPQPQQNLRQKGKNASHGKILKGCVQDAGSKLSIGSIPSTYQAIIYRNNSVQAFGSGSARFQHLSDFTNIAPNQYQKEKASVFRWKNEESVNRRGYGPLLSKDKRMAEVKGGTPGPGSYGWGEEGGEGREGKGGKVMPIGGAEERFKEKEREMPGPADYQPVEVSTTPPGWKSSFQSRVKRDKYMANNSNPGPGTYQHPAAPHHIPSPKLSTPKYPNQNLQHLVSKVMGSQECKRNYCYDMPDFLPKYSKIKNSPIFMQGMRDRFGDVKDYRYVHMKKQPTPGPADYQIPSKFSEEKELVSGAGFASATIRELFQKDEKIGPNQMRVFLLGKKRFHLNLDHKWL